jgi:pyrimidine deaminase RibD-like protein
MPRDLISPRTRLEFREYFVTTTLARIHDAFQVGAVPCDTTFVPPVSGQRRSLVEQYYHSVDFTRLEDAQRVLEVYEHVVDDLARQVRFGDTYQKQFAEPLLDKLISALQRDGYTLRDGRLTSQPDPGATTRGLASSLQDSLSRGGHDDIPHIVKSIELAKQCQSEPGKQSPMVGAVVVTSGTVLSIAHRGELGSGEHAEYTALERKLGPDSVVAGATVYTTLEPCTTRNHPKIPCAQRLIDRKVTRVVIGMLDPDPRILGHGVRLLRRHNIEVALYPAEYAAQVEDLNRHFAAAINARSATPAPVPTGTANDKASLDTWRSLTAIEQRLLFHLLDCPGASDSTANLSSVAGATRAWNLAEQQLLALDLIRYTEWYEDVVPVTGYELTQRAKDLLRQALASGQAG